MRDSRPGSLQHMTWTAAHRTKRTCVVSLKGTWKPCACAPSSSQCTAGSTGGTHHVVDGPQDLLHLADLGLVLQEDGGVEVRDLRRAGGGTQ